MEYFQIDPVLLEGFTIFPFHIFHESELFLRANSPLDSEKYQKLKDFSESEIKVQILQNQRITFIRYINLNFSKNNHAELIEEKINPNLIEKIIERFKNSVCLIDAPYSHDFKILVLKSLTESSPTVFNTALCCQVLQKMNFPSELIESTLLAALLAYENQEYAQSFIDQSELSLLENPSEIIRHPYSWKITHDYSLADASAIIQMINKFTENFARVNNFDSASFSDFAHSFNWQEESLNPELIQIILSIVTEFETSSLQAAA